MDTNTLFLEALQLPANAIGYYVNKELSKLSSGRAILFGTEYAFELEEYVRAMEYRFEADDSVFQHIKTNWQGHGRGAARTNASGWYRVHWEGEALEIGLLSWNEGNCEQRYHWILASSQERAERFLCAVCDWAAEVRGEVLVFDNGHWSKSEELYQSIKNATCDNLVLPAVLKDEIQADFRQFFAAREVYERYRIPWKRGVLFLGPPGNGKTHTVKALINQLGAPCLYVKSLKARYATDHETIHDVFERARQTTPCLLILEDLDSLINDRNRSFFLNELDGFASNTGVVVIATTNHPERLDPAILDRPSRFDRKYSFELPAPEERATYIGNWNTTVEPELRLSTPGLMEIVTLTEGFSFAYLKELFVSSMMRWIASPHVGHMDAAMRSQVVLLREQMSHSPTPAPEMPNEEESEMAMMHRRFGFPFPGSDDDE
ncbi:MAG: ATPase, central domain protein [Chthonomonadaceae bacterium]|nr:ATPase, central domain protein [Chthonomonadaceae bacterium]